jgi:hypothetical protein
MVMGWQPACDERAEAGRSKREEGTMSSQPLTPAQAEGIVAERIERYGLGALPDVFVSERPDGKWLVRWDEFERVVPPMAEDPWCAWLIEHVGPLDAESLQTTEC